MSLFIETIKIVDGICYNLSYHIARMKETSRTFYGQEIDFTADKIVVPENLKRGIVKCRILYDYAIRETGFTLYHFRKIERLKMIVNDEIEYPFKSENREVFGRMVADKGGYDDILIVKNGQITDTSFSNVVFLAHDGLYTPSAFLLNGTRRKQLLEEGIIREREIRVTDVSNYQGVFLINAMMDLSDHIYIPQNQIYLF